ncbi:MAG: hypothetical protein AAGB31_14350 [Bdellovibrio sp.]
MNSQLEIMKEAFLMAALHYINETHFEYDLEFEIEYAVDVAVGHFLSEGR